jgi:alginate O-acetyltransferase complex protein AlgI
MSFDSVTFWLFLLITLALWRLIPYSRAKTAVLFASMVFYGWWNPVYLLLIFISVSINYAAAALMNLTPDGRKRKFQLIVCIALNLGMLAVFKYGEFLTGNFCALFDRGWFLQQYFKHLVIPVGISFYTFQAMSYSVDVYMNRIKPARNFRDFFLFVSFFPQLVAGPIIRANELLPQFESRSPLRAAAVMAGFYHIIWGLFMKIVVADNLAPAVEKIFTPEVLAAVNPLTAWLGMVFFSVQIFADFAGYSAIAIGLAYLLGLKFPENFRSPYISSSLREFWSRWHMTLSRWLRDYLYIPLGGNRSGPVKTIFNLLVTMLLGGLWHGASWTFVIWGGLHGAGLAIERMLPGKRPDKTEGGNFRIIGLPAKLLKIAAVYIFVLTAWVFFRAPDFGTAWHVLDKMYIGLFTEPFAAPTFKLSLALLLIPVFLMHFGQAMKEWFGSKTHPHVRAAAAAAMLFCIIVFERTNENPFIYFQF